MTLPPDVLWLLINLLFASGFAIFAYALGILDEAGSLWAFLLAVTIAQATSLLWLFVLVAFTLAGFVITKVRYEEKSRRGLAEPRRGRRGWRNVLANGLPATLVAGVAFAVPDREVGLAFLTAICVAAADTFASELGVFSDRTYLITRPRLRVPPGTNGGVSWWGQAMAGLGASLTAATGALLIGVPLRLAWIAAAMGFVGCQIDSVLGATFERESATAPTSDPTRLLTKADVNFLAITLASAPVLIASLIL